MIAERRGEHRRSAELLADDLRSWFRGDEDEHAEAAGHLVAELAIRWLNRLRKTPPKE